MSKCPDSWIKTEEAADLLSVSIKTIRRMIDRGDLPRPIKCGRMLRWRRQVILDWMAEQEEGS